MLVIMIVDLADSFPKIKELIVSSLKVYHQTFIQFDFRSELLILNRAPM